MNAEAWSGRTEASDEVISPEPARRLAALLGRPEPRGGLSPLWHWLHHLEAPGPGEVGVDGHPARGGFLPPVPGRRMFAGGEVRLGAAIPFHALTRQTRRVASVERKAGRTGAMTIATVEIETTVAGGRGVISEIRRLIYLDARGGPRPAAADPPPRTRAVLEVETDAALLMRFSALTYNGHRIHYDRGYAKEVEGYPERVVHGPLQAMLMAAVAEGRLGPPATFSFRLTAPLFCGERLAVHAVEEKGALALECRAPDGAVTARASAEKGNPS